MTQAKNRAMSGGLPRAVPADGEEAAESSQPLLPSSTHDAPSTPFTSFVTSTVSRSHQSNEPTSTPDATQSAPLSSTSSTATPIKSSARSSLSPSSSHIWHPTQVGTVVAESEIPEAWAPKNLDETKQKNELFIVCMSLVFVLTLVGIIGAGCWTTFWDSQYIPKKISKRTKRAAAKKKKVKERERVRAYEDAVELQKEVQRQEEVRLLAMEMMLNWDNREREMIVQEEVEEECESEGVGAPTEESTKGLLVQSKYT